MGRSVLAGAVIAVRNGNKTDTQSGKQSQNIFSSVQVFPAEPGKILYDDAVHFSRLHRLDHLLKMRTVKVGSGIIVVIALHTERQIRVPVNILVNQIPLILNAVAFVILPPRLFRILFGKTAIGVTEVCPCFGALKKLPENKPPNLILRQKAAPVRKCFHRAV